VLHSVAWAGDHATGSAAVVDASQSWAGHGLFLKSD
jgi:hypothetical protein